jgi:hypothetical protein
MAVVDPAVAEAERPPSAARRRQDRVPSRLPPGRAGRLGDGRRRPGRATAGDAPLRARPRPAKAGMHVRSLHGGPRSRPASARVRRAPLALPAAAARNRLRPRRACAQFLTERHGGSDVGANRVEAVLDGGAWRLHGEKWLCSVGDADQFVVTARTRGAPDGTRGIGCFLVARSEGGFRIRRLKDKLGTRTRALATGEIEFDGATAYPSGRWTRASAPRSASSTPRAG